MAFPQPQSGKHHCRKEDKSSWSGVTWKLVKRTINVAVDRNTKNDVNTTKNRALCGHIHGRLREPVGCTVLRSPLMTLGPTEAASWAPQYRIVLRTRRSNAA